MFFLIHFHLTWFFYSKILYIHKFMLRVRNAILLLQNVYKIQQCSLCVPLLGCSDIQAPFSVQIVFLSVVYCHILLLKIKQSLFRESFPSLSIQA